MSKQSVKTSFQVITRDSEISFDAFEIVFTNEGTAEVVIMDEGNLVGAKIPQAQRVDNVPAYQSIRLCTGSPNINNCTPFSIKFGAGERRLIVTKTRISS